MKNLIMTLTAVMTVSFAAYSTTIYVPSQYSTIQAGISASVNGDTVLVADGTYTGDGNKNLDFGGRAIVLISENGPDNCVIDCQNCGRGFIFHCGETAASVLSGFQVICGIDSGTTVSFSFGGGIKIINSSPTIENCIIANNRALFGG